jgi:hypothetical protein
MGSVCKSWCAREAGVNAGGSPAGAIRRFSTADRANCVVARRGGEQALQSNRQVAIHMNHRDEPRNSTPGSRAPQVWAKAAEFDPDQPSWVEQWTGGVCVGDMSGSDARVSGETCHGE